MRKPNFVAGSVLFHLVVAFILLILPPPYPKVPLDDSGDYLPVVLTKATSTDVPDTGDRKPMFSGDGPVVFSGRAMMANAGGHFPEFAGGGRGAAEAPPERPAPDQARPAAENRQPTPRSASVAPVGTQPVKDAAAASETTLTTTDGVATDRTRIEFKYQRGWPVPGMVRVKVAANGPGRWQAKCDRDWLIITPATGDGPGGFSVGVDTSRLSLGFYEGTVRVSATAKGRMVSDIPVTLMVLPKEDGRPELPHTSWDRYMSGDCKVCHLPRELLPSGEFMVQPEFCGLCHNKAGMASAKLVGGTGHPMLVMVGSGGTKTPTYGTVATGPKSNRMADHLKDGKLVVCVTCHNVMEKPGDYGRAWEMTTTDDGRTYSLYMGGWAGMGHIVPKVYVTDGLTPRPKMLKSARAYLVDPSGYAYDESEGTVTFKTARKTGSSVYVTLDSPYLRVTTENNRQCYDCHSENTHRGLNCLDCHIVHGTGNIMAIRDRVRTPDRSSRKVVFLGVEGKNSFADGDGAYDGICEVCHTKTKHHRRGAGSTVHADGKDYSGTDCTRCHRHEDGFGA